MKLLLHKTLWGHRGSFTEAVDEAVAAGFHGIEGPVPRNREARAEFIALLEDRGLSFIAEVCSATQDGLYVPIPGKRVGEHLDSLREGIERSLEAGPLFVNTLAGSDLWTFREIVDFHSLLLGLEVEYGIAITLETHRGRPTHHPVRVGELLAELPDLKLNCDFSHFCVVTERLVFDEQPELLDLLASRAYHLHARVGYDQGPQVPDPRAPEYAAALAAHERWWEVVWDSQLARGFTVSTLTPEFGPDGYLQCEPFTGKPVADLWEINRWIADRERDRFHHRYGP